MSNISDVHNVTAFDAKKSRALDGQRLAKVVYKTPKKGTKKDSKCVSIPVISQLDAAFVNDANPYIVSMYHDAQDAIIRELVDKGATEVRDSQIDNAAVLQYLAELAAGNRLSKEAAAEWFDTSMGDVLTVAFADKMGVTDTPTEEQTATITQAIAVYKDKFCGMAGGKTKYDKETALRLLKAIEIAGADDDIATKFQKRLEVMRDAPTGADMMGL